MLFDRNGVIVSYNITYYSNQWMHTNTVQVSGSTTSQILGELIPFTTYNITIRAATVVGFGPPSVDVLATTLQACMYSISIKIQSVFFTEYINM